MFRLDFGGLSLKLDYGKLSSWASAAAMGPRIAVEGEGEGDNISFRVRLPNNILNHVLVISGVNYTSGFPLELARGVPMHLRAKLYESGLRREWWFLAASILRSEAESIDQLLGLIDELEAFLHDSKTPRNLKTAINREECISQEIH